MSCVVALLGNIRLVHWADKPDVAPLGICTRVTVVPTYSKWDEARCLAYKIPSG